MSDRTNPLSKELLDKEIFQIFYSHLKSVPNTEKIRHLLESETQICLDVEYVKYLFGQGKYTPCFEYLRGFIDLENADESAVLFLMYRQEYCEALDRRDYMAAANILSEKISHLPQVHEELLNQFRELINVPDLRTLEMIAPWDCTDEFRIEYFEVHMKKLFVDLSKKFVMPHIDQNRMRRLFQHALNWQHSHCEVKDKDVKPVIKTMIEDHICSPERSTKKRSREDDVVQTVEKKKRIESQSPKNMSEYPTFLLLRFEFNEIPVRSLVLFHPKNDDILLIVSCLEDNQSSFMIFSTNTKSLKAVPFQSGTGIPKKLLWDNNGNYFACSYENTNIVDVFKVDKIDEFYKITKRSSISFGSPLTYFLFSDIRIQGKEKLCIISSTVEKTLSVIDVLEKRELFNYQFEKPVHSITVKLPFLFVNIEELIICLFFPEQDQPLPIRLTEMSRVTLPKLTPIIKMEFLEGDNDTHRQFIQGHNGKVQELNDDKVIHTYCSQSNTDFFIKKNHIVSNRGKSIQFNDIDSEELLKEISVECDQILNFSCSSKLSFLAMSGNDSMIYINSIPSKYQSLGNVSTHIVLTPED